VTWTHNEFEEEEINIALNHKEDIIFGVANASAIALRAPDRCLPRVMTTLATMMMTLTMLAQPAVLDVARLPT
jgi:hypothetical protein